MRHGVDFNSSQFTIRLSKLDFTLKIDKQLKLKYK